MSQTKFSKKIPLTLENIEKIPNNKPGIYRILNKKEDIILFWKIKNGGMKEDIWNHKGTNNEGVFFQYKIALNNKEADKMQQEELKKWKPVFE